jgi:periplasmic protein TonB
VKFSTALLLAAALHAVGIVVLWRTWPAAAPAGEVVPLELRAAEPPPPPPAPELPAQPAAGGGGNKKRTPRMTVALQPEPAGDVPVAPSPVAETPNGGGGTGGARGGGGGGGGGGGSGGASAGPAVANPAKVDHGPLRTQAMERIRQQRRYPELARRRHIEGTVSVLFRVAADGAVTGLRVKQSADELLDEAALEAVRAAAPLPAALSQDGELEVLLQFYLRP